MRPLPLISLSLLAVSLVLLWGCRDPSSVRLGLLAGMAGASADLGIDGRMGTVLAVEEMNQAGGLHGRPIELVTGDHRGEVEEARALYRSLVEAGVAAIVGPFTSEISLAILPLVEETGVLTVSPTASSPLLSGRDDALLRTYTSSIVHAQRLADHLALETPARRLVALYDSRNRAHGQPFAEHFRDRFEERGGEVLAVLSFGDEKPLGIHSIVERALALQPDALVLVAGPVETALICQQVFKLGQTLPLYGTEWSSSTHLVEHGARAVEGFTFIQTVDLQSSSPRYTEFVERFEKRFGRPPGFAAVLAYEATRITLDGLDHAREPAEARDWILAQGEFQTLQGALHFDAFGDCLRAAHLMRIEDARLQRLGSL